MRNRVIAIAALAALIAGTSAPASFADAPAPTQSMTHIKTEKGIAATLKGAGVFLYSQGGATSAVIGESIAATDSQFVFHVPAALTKTGVTHAGSTIVFFNSANNKVVQLRNPVIDLAKGTVSAVVPQASADPMVVLTITNAKDLKAKVTTDKKLKLRTTAYAGAKLSHAPGIAAAVTSLLGLPAGALPDGLAFAAADVTLKAALKK